MSNGSRTNPAPGLCMENPETRPLELAFAPEESTGRSFFRDVPWRWSDVVVCLAPYVAFWVSRRLWPGMLAGTPNWLRLGAHALGRSLDAGLPAVDCPSAPW